MTLYPPVETVPDSAPVFDYPSCSASAYAAAQPFPHLVLHDAWDASTIISCKQQLTRFDRWAGEKNFHGAQRKRYCADADVLPAAVAKVLHEASKPRFLRWLQAITGIEGLLPDPYFEGGGAHQIGRGGFLRVHADFNWNDRIQLYRRLNLLLYLNSEWQPDWRGELELWAADMSTCVQRIEPRANTMVVFTTSDTSFHGHPAPLTCPDGVTRDSIALYYYTAQAPVGFASRRVNTDYRNPAPLQPT